MFIKSFKIMFIKFKNCSIISIYVTTGSIIVTSQLPIEEWYAYFKNPTLADAIMDRLIHNAYKINLKGESMRKIKNVMNLSDKLEQL